MSKKKGGKNKNILMVYAEFAAFIILRGIVQAVNMYLAVRIAYALSTVIFALDSKHRTRTISHLIHAKIAKKTQEAFKIARKVYRHLTTLSIEIIKFDRA